ncbi:MAG: cupin-like domain-containing protein [Acidobacteriaceae bacterium]|nr:cupin-like domain-containing protein [Acidobacteriaceae bacterium]
MNPFLSELMRPMSWDEFLDTAWAKIHVYHSATDARRFEGLFGWNDLNRILEQCRLPAPRLRLYRNGAEVDAKTYSHVIGAERIIHAQDLESCLASGATLIIDEVDELHTPLRHLAVCLEEKFRSPVNINAYASWKATPGFDLHWDEQDVFIIQLAGRKNWRVHPPRYPDPSKAQPKCKEPPAGEPVFDAAISEGDVLYLPRGWWHQVTPVNESSLHLTVSINSPMAIELMQWLAHSLRGEAVLRQRLAAWTDQAGLELREILGSRLAPGLMEQFQRENTVRPSRRQWFSLPALAAVRIANLPPSAAIRNVHPRGSYTGPSQSPGCFEVTAGGSSWAIPENYREAVARLTSFEPIRISALKELCSRTAWTFIEQLIQQWLDQRILAVVQEDKGGGEAPQRAISEWTSEEIPVPA